MVGDQDQGRGGEVGGERAEATHEVLAPAEVEAGGRLVEQHQLGVGHQGPGDLHPLALALGQRAEAAVGQVVGTERLEQLVGAALVEAVVGLAPPADDAVRGGDDDVAHALVGRDALGQGGRGEADARAQLEHVDRAEHLAEDADDAGGRVDACRGELEQRGLAGAVGPEHDPALSLLDLPADVVQDHRVPADDSHAGHRKDIAHAPNTNRVRASASGASGRPGRPGWSARRSSPRRTTPRHVDDPPDPSGRRARRRSRHR